LSCTAIGQGKTASYDFKLETSLRVTDSASPERSADAASDASSLTSQPRRVFDVPLRPANIQPSTQFSLDEDWVDLYQILGVPNSAPPREIEEAIINSGADALFFAFSRGYKPLSVQLLERHQGDFRPVLLDPATRRRYDEQCSLHHAHDERAISYEVFLGTVKFPRRGGCLSAVIFLLCLGPVANGVLALREVF
jgi:hypothetical protein